MRAPLTAAVTLTIALGMLSRPALADPNVVVSSFANPDYTKAKFGGEIPRAESYVVMQGQFFEGTMVDNSIDRMPFRRLMDFFAPELAKRQYWPAKTAGEADLLIVVHWGTTTHQVSSDEMRGRVSAVTDMSESSAVVSKALMEGQAGGGNAGMSLMLGASDPIARQLQADNLEIASEQARSDLVRASNAQLLGYTRELRKLSTTLGIILDAIKDCGS